MFKRFLFLIAIVISCLTASAQSPNQKTLFIIDSIPLINDPEEWNQVLANDIADINIVSNKDTLRLLGWNNVDAIAFVFTKAYRSRPDSVKRIPSLKQMQATSQGIWQFRGQNYTGRYIDYYYSGKIQNEGELLDGKLNGQLIIYFKNGNKKSIAEYKNGVQHGIKKEYYKSGALFQQSEFIEGKFDSHKTYFINGQIEDEIRPKAETAFDTSLTYYSTGKVKDMAFRKKDVWIKDKKKTDLNYYSTHFFQSINSRNLIQANRQFYQIWLLDSTSADTKFKEGLLLARESRFEESIAAFDRALEIEPLMREALVNRAVVRVLKNLPTNPGINSSQETKSHLRAVDLMHIPNEEMDKICNDLMKADEVDYSEFYVYEIVPIATLNICKERRDGR